MHHRKSHSRALVGIALLSAAAAVLTGCASSTTPATSDLTVDSVESALETTATITVWSWQPGIEDIAAAFMDAYPDITVEVVNAGQGNDEYAKLSSSIKAGSGAPDVVQLEYSILPQYATAGDVVNVSAIGYDDLADTFTASAYAQSKVGDDVFAYPMDDGPMAMYYRTDIFEEYGIAVPTTWDEFAAAAETLHAADPSKYLTAIDPAGAMNAEGLIGQAGGVPYQTDGSDVTIDLADAGTTQWADYWSGLLESDVVKSDSFWTDGWWQALDNGTYATWIAGAWAPSSMESTIPNSSGKWAVAPVPSWDASDPTSGVQGGSGIAVTSQSENQAVSAAFARWMTTSDTATDALTTDLKIYPTSQRIATSDEWLGAPSEYFGGQEINRVFSESGENVKEGFQYLPFQQYADSIFSDYVGAAFADKTDISEALVKYQAALVKFAGEQGYTVK